MLSPELTQRLNLLLDFAKNPSHNLTARENIAAAKELIDTVLACRLISLDDYKALRSRVIAAQVEVSNAELARVVGALERPFNRFDGTRFIEATTVLPAVSDDGAYRYNPLSGAF